MQTHEWTTETVPAMDRFGYWQRAVCEGVVGAETVEPHGGAFYARLAARRTADCGFVTFASSGHAVVRTERLARRDEAPFLLSLQLEGESRYGGDAGEPLTMQRGDISLVNSARPFRVLFPSDVHRIIALVPRPLLRARVPWCGDIGTLKIDGAHAAADPLRAYLATAGRFLAALDSRTAEAFIANAADLLALALAPSADAPSLRHARFAALCAHVSRNLANPSLAPRHAADALGLSLRQLHRIFGENGTTFGRFLLERRLEACRKCLDDPAQAGRTISDIAFAAGFNELSHFSRAFRARFGAAPRVYRARAAGDA